ncbi:MAG: hypothetical protein AAGF53_18525, partial [Pseudomonadota bacterium]
MGTIVPEVASLDREMNLERASRRVTRPRQRSHSLCKHGAAPGGRLIWLEPPHIGGQISRDNRFWGWGL